MYGEKVHDPLPNVLLVQRVSVAPDEGRRNSLDCAYAPSAMPRLWYPILSVAVGKAWD